MKPIPFLLLIIVIMHFGTIINQTIFSGNYGGIVIALNTFLFILAFGLVLPLKSQNKRKK